MIPRYLDIKIKLAYLHLKRKIAVYFILWISALIAGASLMIASLFYPYSLVLKLWTVVLIVLIFVKLGYNVAADMKQKYESFKSDKKVTDNTLRKF